MKLEKLNNKCSRQQNVILSNRQNGSSTTRTVINFQNSNDEFPALKPNSSSQLSSGLTPAFNPTWSQPSSNQNSSQQFDDLFTEQEITSLTSELVLGLKNCKNKHDQFNVIAQLAVKYLGANHNNK